ncbi:hypothetical protein GT360_08270 [Vibrio astriarenae]|uniref:Uncharacterized protein n=1 Tax=Vibrio astriarenae TaxID=1481923 RepID=A0A7Z2YDL5_9VIBR|nr:hypothetical protein [Vibrio astriarenae]QIA63513.1 hypothetical protein GT360_08270 [Vibrio astriarenae]
MLLEQILEVIEFTDSDFLEEAMELCNRQGVVSSDHFPFFDCVFEQAPNELCARLSRLGFKGSLEVQKVNFDGSERYAVVDTTREPQALKLVEQSSVA